MNAGRWIIVMILGILVSQKGFAGNICVSSASEFAAQSANFPPVVQKLPALLATDGMFVTAGIKIREAGDKLKLEGYVWQPGDIYVDDAYIGKACFDGKVLNVTLENGKAYSVKIKGDSSVSIQGVTFDKVSEQKFANVVGKVNEARAKKADVGGVR